MHVHVAALSYDQSDVFVLLSIPIEADNFGVMGETVMLGAAE